MWGTRIHTSILYLTIVALALHVPSTWQAGTADVAIKQHDSTDEQDLLSPEDFAEADALSRDAWNAIQSGKLGLARQLLQQAVDVDPENPEHRIHLANLLTHQGDEELAQQEFEKALELKPDDVYLQLTVPLSVFSNETYHRLKRFQDIFQHHILSMGDTSVPASGPYATIEGTETLRDALSGFLHEHKVTSLIDIGCGDMTWMSQVAMEDIAYTGTDVVPALVNVLPDLMRQVSNKKDRKFIFHDVLASPPPKHDVIFCREVFVHFRSRDILTALENFNRSGSRYLIVDTYPNITDNVDRSENIFTLPGAARRIYNLELPPFSLSAPMATFDVNLGNGGVMGVWQLPLYVKHGENTVQHDEL